MDLSRKLFKRFFVSRYGYGYLSARIEARPEALAGFLRDAEAIAAELRDRPIEADELQRAARAFLRPDRAWKLVIVPEAPAP